MYCINPKCTQPQNTADLQFCVSCGSKLRLKERYRATGPIGQGGFGRTFLAMDEDKPSKPPCVIKQFYPQVPREHLAKAIDLFNHEAEQLDRLGKHPQIPDLYAYFTQDDRQYLIQEYIPGENLEKELDRFGNFDENKIRQVLTEILDVLEFLSDLRIIHRDIKPENIIRRNTDNKLVLVDFGTAKMLDAAAMLKPGTSIGSPEYIAPEQARGQATFASDLFSLGVTCLHLLTSISPFDLYDVNLDRWIWRDYLTMSIDSRLGSILDRLVENTPSRRYQNVAEVKQDLGISRHVAIPNPSPIANPPIVPAAAKIPPPPPAITTLPPPKRGSTLDADLAALGAEFGSSQPSSPPTNTPTPTTAKPKPSNIDSELEQLRTEFLKNQQQ
jgi:serine/threonine protein kinase